jgi:hypothetical protein
MHPSPRKFVATAIRIILSAKLIRWKLLVRVKSQLNADSLGRKSPIVDGLSAGWTHMDHALAEVCKVRTKIISLISIIYIDTSRRLQQAYLSAETSKENAGLSKSKSNTLYKNERGLIITDFNGIVFAVYYQVADGLTAN